MYLQCRGTRSPAVVLVSGLDSAADVRTGYQPDPSLTVFARVCAYDRPGAPVGDNLTPSRSTPVPLDGRQRLSTIARVDGPGSSARR